jgi:hypothetical protein
LGAIAVLLGGCAAASASVNVVAITQWLPVTDEERNLKAPKIDPEAGAEALFWRVHIVDEFNGRDPQTVLYHYLRIKIFDERGAKAHGTQDIPFFGKRSILDVAGRTIKPDGTIVELKKDSVFQRDIVKIGGIKIKAVSFAMPAVEPGVIIEYRWREVRDGEHANYVRLPFQRNIPVHEVEYFIRPLTSTSATVVAGMRRVSFGVQPSPIAQEKDGFYSTFLQNVPAFKEEPQMPSEWVVRPWTLLYYAHEIKASQQEFWEDQGKTMYSLYEQHLKTTGEVRDAAEAAVAGAQNPEEKLIKLLQYCQGRIKRLSDDDVTAREREKAKQNDKPSDTLKRGIGTSFDVKMLFAAMARAQGFDVRVARLGSRNDRPFDPAFLNTFFLRSFEIAVRVGDRWRFYDPAAKWLPGGMVPWDEEGSDALVTDPKASVFTKVPFSEPEKSLTLRTGVFELDEEGTLEGEASLAYSGHAAANRRSGKARESAAQREDDIRELVRGQVGNAEVSEVKVENIEDAEKPLTYSYRVKVPGYAQRTGKRLFVPLSYFQHGHPARFPASERKYPVWFEYPWAEEDNVSIKVPKGFELENAEAPASFGLGEVGEYRVSAKAGGGRLVYQRKLIFGRGGALVFPLTTYPALKKVFDAIHDQDQHTITLRQQAAGAGAGQ